MQVEHGATSPMQTIPSMLAMIDTGAKLGTSSKGGNGMSPLR
jgi:hypothetical protein